MPQNPVVHNSDKQRFEVDTDGSLALLEYKLREHQIIFTHTEVPSAAEGQGIGSSLAETALDYARDQRLEIVPACEFVIAYIKRHPEYVPLVSPKHRSKVERHSH
jgi:predicted GNAT family acetyltransferase